MTDRDRREKFEQYRKEKLKRVPLDMQKTEYERLKVHAQMKGMAVNGYIKETLKERMDKEDKQLGVEPGTVIRIDEDGNVRFYKRFDE